MQTLEDMRDEYNTMAWRLFDIVTQLRHHNANESSIVQAEDEMARYVTLRSVMSDVIDKRKLYQ